MIPLTRLSGSVFLLNADLVERVDSTPDTVITLVDGKKYVVAETMAQVRDAVVAYRAEIVALGGVIDSGPGTPRTTPRLAPVTHLADERRTGGEG